MSSRRQVLLDSNVIIYAASDTESVAAAFMNSITPAASVITKIEVLGFHRLTATDRSTLESYFDVVTLVPLEEAIVERAIAVRQIRKMSLGDAIIAATALEYGLPLATHNTRDFDWIGGLAVIDPMST